MSQRVKKNWHSWWLQPVTLSDIKPKICTHHSQTQSTSVHRPDCKVGAEESRICACDPQCARYGDCCRSSPYFVPEEQRLGASPFTCASPSLSFAYVMATCPPEWKDSDTRNRCEHPDGNYRDPLLDAPLISLSTNTTYQNWHCAYCHGDLDAATTVIWEARFSCYGSYLPILLPYETIAEHLSFNPLTSTWNLNISLNTSNMKSNESTPGYIQRSTDDNNKQEINSNCSISFKTPMMNLPLRSCNPKEVRRCSDSWEDAEVKAQCEAYTARLCSGPKTYRNRHCMLCNNLDVPEPCRYYFYSTRAPAEIPFLTMLLDWRRLKRGACATSEIYDPLSCVCRKVFVWEFQHLKNVTTSWVQSL